MKKISKTLSKDYLPVKVFLEDLEEMEQVLKESGRGFKLETDDYEFSCVKELQDKYGNQELNKLKISAYDPYITIELNRLWVRLYCGSDETKDAGIFYKLDSILSATLRRPTLFYSYYTSWVVILIGNVLSGISSEFPKGASVVFLLLLFVWIFWVAYIRLRKSGEIILAKRGDFQDFFVRNKDQIILVSFGSMIGAIFTVIVTVYFPLIQKLLRTFF